MKKSILLLFFFQFSIFISFAQAPVFYGMTNAGGSVGSGAIISFNPTTDAEDTVHSFGQGDDGQTPFSTLIYDAGNGLFYGMAPHGGSLLKGAIISFNPTTNTEDTVHSFGRGDDGQASYGPLVYDAGNGLFYGMTEQGGSLNKGAIISFNPITNTEDTVHSFGRGDDGQTPFGSLVYYAGNGLFYGMTEEGGKFNKGAIITFNPITNAEDTVYSFKSGDDGQIPEGELVYYPGNGLFYGMTLYGGSLNEGAIIRFNPTTNAEDTIHSFGRGKDGAYAFGNLVYYSGNGLFYGMTVNGGNLNMGAIITFNPTTNIEDTVHSFGRGDDGAYSHSNLVYDARNGLFYGMTAEGGSLSLGAIIRFNPNTNAEDTVHCFGRSDDGTYPEGDLVLYTPPCTLNTSASVIQNALCNGSNTGSTHATITGGEAPFTYMWSPNGGTKDTANGLTAGSYTVTVHDNNGCSSTASITITQPNPINVTINSLSEVSENCLGSAWINASGGTLPYTYSWNPGGNTTDSISHKCAGYFCCTVTDASGCSNSVCVTIANAAGINNPVNKPVVTIFPNPNNGVFNIVVSGKEQGISEMHIEVYNVLGERVYSTPLSLPQVGDFQIDLSNQPNGVYLYRAIAPDGSLIWEGKLVIQK